MDMEKKTNLDEFPLQGKNGKGVIIYKETPGTGPVVGAAMVSETDNLLLSGKNAICIAANEVPLLGRTATGNIMIKQGEIGSIIKL